MTTFNEQIKRFAPDKEGIPTRPVRKCSVATHQGKVHDSIARTCKDGVHVSAGEVVEFIERCALGCFPIDLKSFGENVDRTFNHRGVKYFPHKNVPVAACYHPLTCENERCRYLHGTRDALVDKFAGAALDLLPFDTSSTDITRAEVKMRVQEEMEKLASGVIFDMRKLLRLPIPEDKPPAAALTAEPEQEQGEEEDEDAVVLETAETLAAVELTPAQAE